MGLLGNMSVPIVERLPSNTTVARLLLPNALPHIVVTLLGMVTVVSWLLRNTDPPTVTRVGGRVIDVI